jgi:hypothetical protein
VICAVPLSTATTFCGIPGDVRGAVVVVVDVVVDVEVVVVDVVVGAIVVDVVVVVVVGTVDVVVVVVVVVCASADGAPMPTIPIMTMAAATTRRQRCDERTWGKRGMRCGMDPSSPRKMKRRAREL